tara:strand:- start:87 stop:509 length:423 start_codon:yes stop_codon:yes gene_type:complete
MSIKRKAEKKMLYKNLTVLIFITLLASVFSFFVIDIIFEKLFKDKFIDAIPVIKIIIICWFFITIIKITNYPMTDSIGEIKKINCLAYVIFLINSFLIHINYFFFDINAISVSIFFLISVKIHFVANLFLLKNKIKISFR